MSSINERIRELRQSMHLSQDNVAKYLGVNRATYTQLENGHRKVLAVEAAKLSRLFGVTVDMLTREPDGDADETIRDVYIIEKDSDYGRVLSDFMDMDPGMQNRLIGYMKALKEMRES